MGVFAKDGMWKCAYSPRCESSRQTNGPPEGLSCPTSERGREQLLDVQNERRLLSPRKRTRTRGSIVAGLIENAPARQDSAVHDLGQ